MNDLKLALRTLLRTPFVTAIAVISLALGIGANAAIFSLLDQMLVRSLPVQEPERLVNVVAPGTKGGSISCSRAGSCEEILSYPMFRDLQREVAAFEGLAGHRPIRVNLSQDRRTRSGDGVLVSGSYFPVLGIRPALGRLLGPEDDRRPGEHPVVVLSHRYWERELGGDPGVLNRTIVVNGVSLTIVGVAQRGFEGTTLGARPDVFVPLTMRGEVEPGDPGFDNRRSYWLYAFARLKPGVDAEGATASANAAYRPIIEDVEAPLQEGWSSDRLARFREKELVLRPGHRGQSALHREARAPLVLLFSITLVVLLIACANIANLLLVRGAGRAQEMAVRASLGGGRARLVGQLLLEAVVLAAVGALASLVVASWTLGIIGSIMPAEASTVLELRVNPQVVGFTGLLAVTTGLLFGLYPALHATRTDLVTALKANAGQPSGSRGAARFRSALVTLQIALSMALLVAAGLFLRSLVNVSRVDLGLDPTGVVTFSVMPVLNGYEAEHTRGLFARMEEELAAIPGVGSVAGGMIPILSGSNMTNNVSVEGFEREPDQDVNAAFNAIGPGYFSTLGAPLLAGREFTASDTEGAPFVAVVNEAFTRKFGLDGREAVGAMMSVGYGEDLETRIVGVVADTKYSGVKQEDPPMYFFPWRQRLQYGVMTFYLRTSGDPAPIIEAARQTVERIDPNLPVDNLKTLDQQARENVFVDRVISTLAGAFALLATVLAAVGLYGVLAYSVAQRTREIGIRMALGARSAQVRRMVAWQVARMVAAGGLLGIAAALLVGKAASSLLFGLDGYDPAVVVAVSLLLGLVALAAGLIPALRASRVDPRQALRYE